MLIEPILVTAKVTSVLEGLGVRYLIGGGGRVLAIDPLRH